MDAFSGNDYLIRRKVFALMGAAFHVYDGEGGLQMFIKQKAFKLKEDIRAYSDEEKTTELLTIKARSVVDFSAAYDVVDAQSGEKLGALRRKGLKSILRDSWELLDNEDQPVGKIEEDSMVMATMRRLINWIPQTFHADMDGEQLVTYKQRFNPFVYKLEVRLNPELRGRLDPRVALAGGILISAIEGRQS